MRTLLTWILGFVSFTVIASLLWFWSYTSAVLPSSGSVLVEIPKGAGVRSIGRLLEEKGLITYDVRFLILARLHGSAGKLRAGEYELEFGLTPLQVLETLERGKVFFHSVTIPEGLTAEQIAEVFSRSGWGEKDHFTVLFNDVEFLSSFGIQQKSVEGYLFPDTYYLAKGTVAEKEILQMMVRRFFQVITEIPYQESVFSLHQIVTLASIVEKETGVARERPLIARVFLNRLEKKMRLQSDPTVIYGIENFNGNITRADLRRPTLYNTYVIAALPPGPICNPGRESIEAILSPASSNALYFVSRNDGTHFFSKTLREHNKAVRKFQKQRRKAKN